MADTYLNRVKMTVTGAPGTGTATLNAASTGYVAFASGDGGKTFSILWEDTGNAWEIGTGCTYTHSGTTLTRGTRVGSSSGSALSLTSAATATVIIEAGAANTWTSQRTLAVFTPLDNQPPATNFATLDTRNSVAVLDFDAGTDESAVFVGDIPQGADLSAGIKVVISWAASTATSGACIWAAEFEKTTGQDIDSDSFDTATTATTTTSGTSGVVNTTTITCTAIDSLAVGDCFRVKIRRDADAAGDTMTGDAELVAVELQQVA